MISKQVNVIGGRLGLSIRPQGGKGHSVLVAPGGGASGVLAQGMLQAQNASSFSSSSGPVRLSPAHMADC